jgi:hypothetical protein
MKISRRAFLAATGGAVTLGPLAACAAEGPAAGPQAEYAGILLAFWYYL